MTASFRREPHPVIWGTQYPRKGQKGWGKKGQREETTHLHIQGADHASVEVWDFRELWLCFWGSVRSGYEALSQGPVCAEWTVECICTAFTSRNSQWAWKTCPVQRSLFPKHWVLGAGEKVPAFCLYPVSPPSWKSRHWWRGQRWPRTPGPLLCNCHMTTTLWGKHDHYAHFTDEETGVRS